MLTARTGIALAPAAGGAACPGETATASVMALASVIVPSAAPIRRRIPDGPAGLAADWDDHAVIMTVSSICRIAVFCDVLPYFF
jgi:hypothetical protein